MEARRAKDVSTCGDCKKPIDGTKIATEDAGVLCVPCARRSHGIAFPMGAFLLQHAAGRKARR